MNIINIINNEINNKINNLKKNINNYYNNYNNNYYEDFEFISLKNKYLDKIIIKINYLNEYFNNQCISIGGGYILTNLNIFHPVLLQILNKDLELELKIKRLTNEIEKYNNLTNNKLLSAPPLMASLITSPPLIPSPIISPSIKIPLILTPPPLVKSPQAKTKIDIKIFNWNICWQCMKGENQGSAGKLGLLCNPDKCLINVKKIISDLYDFDFITLQEATEWENIISNISFTHGYIHFKSGNSEMVTLYKKNKFNVIGFTSGNIKTQGRLYQIIFFETKIQPIERIILVNLHNGHNISKNDLENSLNINNCYFNKDNNIDFNNIEQLQKKESIKSYVEGLINIYVIVAGDFNDSGEQYFSGLQPFKTSSLHINNILVSSNFKIPPKTCCSNNAPPDTKYLRYGDYILYSKNFNIKKNNLIYQINNSNKVLASDHLPIYTELEIN